MDGMERYLSIYGDPGHRREERRGKGGKGTPPFSSGV